MSNGKKDKFNFGQAYSELEEIIRWFERGDVDLEAALDKFERGLELAGKCRERLKEVENRVSRIKAKFEGSGDAE
jgi:exodeoxyribonuclease VII small subunit